MHCIYAIQNKINLKIYIGQSVRPKTRWRTHKSYARSVLVGKKTIKDNSIQVIHLALAKYGIDNFEFQILEEWDTQEEADDAEMFWIEFLQSRSNRYGYNITPGGSGVGCGADNPLYGQTPHNKLFTDEQEQDICNKYSQGLMPITKLGVIYNCTEVCIFQILKRHNIKTLGNAVFSKGKRHSPATEFKPGQAAHNKRFTTAQEQEICSTYVNEKLNTIQLANIYGCHKSMIARMLDRNGIKKRKRGLTELRCG